MKNFLKKLLEVVNSYMPLILFITAIANFAKAFINKNDANSFWVSGMLFLIVGLVYEINNKVDSIFEILSLENKAIQLIGNTVFQVEETETKTDSSEPENR